MKTKHLFALIFVVLLGLGTQKLKQLSLLSPNAAKITRLDIRTMDYEMYKRSNLEMDRAESRREAKAYRMAGVGTFKNDEIFGRPKAKGEVKAAAAAADAKKKKKKKKTKNLNARRRTDLDVKTAVYSESQKQKSNYSDEASSSQMVTNGPIIPRAKEQNEQDAKDIATWTARLLARADKVAVTEFIRAYQSNQISEVVFYTLVDLMYAERSSDFKSLAILSAGSVSTLRSYDFLFKVLTDEDSGSGLASQSQAELHEYASLTSVAVLRQVLTVHLDDDAKIEIAVRTLDVSTGHYLAAAPAPTPTPEEPLTRAPSNSRNQVFATFIAPLEAAIQNYAQNAAISEPAQRTLQRIKSLNNTVAQVEQQ